MKKLNSKKAGAKRPPYCLTNLFDNYTIYSDVQASFFYCQNLGGAMEDKTNLKVVRQEKNNWLQDVILAYWEMGLENSMSQSDLSVAVAHHPYGQY